MKYCLRTVTWKFHETIELVPELDGKRRVIVQEPEDIVHNYSSLFKDQVRERFVAFWLDSANKVLGFEVVTEGILNSCLTHPREVFRGAVVATAAAIIIAHNHPSENLEPSKEDIAITKQLVEAGKILGIPVHDHIIFAGESFTSLASLRMI